MTPPDVNCPQSRFSLLCVRQQINFSEFTRMYVLNELDVNLEWNSLSLLFDSVG
jgi:hypothetical protein